MAFQELVWPLAGAAGAAGFAAWAFYHRYYVPVPPGKALVLFGRRSVGAGEGHPTSPTSLVAREPQILVGGGTVIGPWNRGVGYLTLHPPDTEADVRALHTVEGGRTAGWEVSVHVQVKIPTEPESLRRAAAHLLGKSDDEVRLMVRHAVESTVPAVLARVPVSGDEPDWDRLAAEVEASIAPELVDYGLVVRSVAVTGLRRISPSVEPTRIEAAERHPSPTAVFPGLDGPDSEFALRLARVERGLGLMGSQVVRLLREPPAAPLDDGPGFGGPLHAPVSPAEALGDGTYNSTGRVRAPRLARPESSESSEEGR